MSDVIKQIEMQIVDEVLEASHGDALRLIVRHLEALKSNREPSEFKLFLQSFWRHLEGVRVIREESDFDQAVELEDSAAAGFQQLGFDELESVSRAMSAYATAIVEVRRFNFNRGLELFAAIEEFLRHAGRFAAKFQPFIDHMKPEAMFLGFQSALLAADTGTARILATRASEMSKTVAEKYYGVGTPGHFTYLGLASFYGAYFSYHQSQINLSNLDLTTLVTEDISSGAKEAEQLLAQADLANAQIQAVHHLSKALVQLLEVTNGIATRMHLCFKAAFKPDLKGFMDLRAKTRKAIEHASKAGPQALPLVRSCDGLLARIQNLENLARPKKVDFGIYSGLISAALFVPLLVIAAWASHAFEFNLDGQTLFLTIAGLALIGGFGFGALRFKNLLFSIPSRADGSTVPNRVTEGI